MNLLPTIREVSVLETSPYGELRMYPGRSNICSGSSLLLFQK